MIWDLGYIHKLKKLVRLLGQCLQYTINKGDEDQLRFITEITVRGHFRVTLSLCFKGLSKRGYVRELLDQNTEVAIFFKKRNDFILHHFSLLRSQFN